MNKIILFVFLFSLAGQAQITENDGDWSVKDTVMFNTPEARIMIRTGDIDNLKFGWPVGFDPFSGNNTPSHSFPWTPDTSDPAGTDRIMVITSYSGTPPAGKDGYTNSTSRPGNAVSPVTLHYKLNTILVNSAILQMFVDDFQAPNWKANYQVKFNGIRIPLMETIINSLSQTGPIGKIITARIPDEFLYLVEQDSLQILIDDFTTGAGDGFAIDFAKLLINPDSISQLATIKGNVKDYNTGKSLIQVKVTANGVASAFTDSLGNYTIDSVLAGLVTVETFKTGYGSQSKSVSVTTGSTTTVNFSLKSPAPMVVSHTPADSMYGVTADSVIEVRFSTAIDPNTIKDFTFYLSDTNGTVSGQYEKSDSSVIFIPDTLLPDNDYVLTLTTGITDLNAIALDKSYSWRFFTYKKPVSAINLNQPGKTLLQFELLPVYPNPFNPQTTIRYRLLTAGKVKLMVYDLRGQMVRQLIDRYQTAGSYTEVFDSGSLASGLYFIRLDFAGQKMVRKALLVR